MAFNVTEFRTNLALDGARPNLFSVNINFPSIAASPIAASRLVFLAKAASLPGSEVGVATQMYFGREVKFAGNRRFSDWTIQIINDEDFTIRNAFEQWMNAINSHSLNIRNPIGISPLSYTADASVTQYSKVGVAGKTYKFVGMFPTSIGDIALDWGNNNAIEEFTVTFTYQYWTSDTTT